MSNVKALPTELWRHVVDLLVLDISLVPTSDEPVTTHGHLAVQMLGLVNSFFYDITRRHMWEAVVVCAHSAPLVLARINQQSLRGRGLSLAAFVKKLVISWTTTSPDAEAALQILVSHTTNLRMLSFWSSPRQDGQEVDARVPYGLLPALIEARPPLRHLALRGPWARPLLSQLNLIVAAFTSLDSVTIDSCSTRDALETQQEMAQCEVRRLKLSPSRSPNGLGYLATHWKLGGVAQLEVNHNVSIIPWLEKFGSTLNGLTCPGEAFASEEMSTALIRTCPKLEVLVLQMSSSGDGPRRIPDSVRSLSITAADVVPAYVFPHDLACYIQDYLQVMDVAATSQLRRIALAITPSDLDPEWLTAYGGRCEEMGIELQMNEINEYAGYDG